jgi:hypothetical protein
MISVPAQILLQAVDVYVQRAYPAGALPPSTHQRIEALRALPPSDPVPESLLEKDTGATSGYALRLGQPLYPHMKLIIEAAPASDPATSFLFRVDTHDRHLHAAPGSPDAAWLASIRNSNKQITDQIEAAWSDAGLPTFKDYLRQQLEARKAKRE